MKLSEYQESNGVEFEENINLIKNPFFVEGMHLCIDWSCTKSKRSLVSKVLSKALQKFQPEKQYKLSLPEQEKVIFFGSLEHSFNDLSSLNNLFKLLSQKTKSRKYIIVCGKGDYDFKQDLINILPNCVSQVFLNNLDIEHERLSYLPMGRDFRSRHLFQKYKPQHKKQYNLYCNFSINTHPIRQDIYNLVQKNDAVEFDHMGNFLKYELSREEFYRKLSLSQFAVCPRGNAIDTFRMWDCLYLGVIPVVLKEAKFHNELEDLPILFLDNLSDFSRLDKSYLQFKYSEILEKNWNYEKLKLSFWRSRISPELINPHN